MVFKLRLERTFEDKVKLLPLVGRELDGLLLLLRLVGRGDEERLAKFPLEIRGQVVIIKAGAALDWQPLALSHD